MKKVITTFIAITVIFSSFGYVRMFADDVDTHPVQIGVNENTAENQIANYQVAAKNEYLTMYADEKGWFSVKNNKTGYIWYSHPNDSLTDKKTIGINKRNFQSECVVYYVYNDDESEVSSYAEASINSNSLVQNGWIKTEKTENGIKVVYDFYPICARISVSYELKGKSFVATIIGNETLEGSAFKKAVKDTLTEEQKSVMQTSYITSIWLLPTFGAAVLFFRLFIALRYNRNSRGGLFIARFCIGYCRGGGIRLHGGVGVLNTHFCFQCFKR